MDMDINDFIEDEDGQYPYMGGGRPFAVPRSQPVNRLAGELSPYLLQHAENPVAWYPWGAEPFEAARREDKPIFLSVGYSSCHWCHVMERECFNDPEVAELLNDACIPVKVDREERPDIDALFMEVCRVQNGSGGWPLNLFLTPSGLPFFSTTWLPKRTRGQMPGLTDIVPRVKWLWLMQREHIMRAANELSKAMKTGLQIAGTGKISTPTQRNALSDMKRTFDLQNGGFKGIPKFPDAPKLIFLFLQSSSQKNTQQDREDAFTMADFTMRKMWRGGIHDHIGGGFARYSTDERWILPHFEKMLPDQALLLLTAAVAQETKRDPFYRTFADDIVSCVTRTFLSPSSAFFSSVDSDNADGEGGYYLWSDDEIHALLPDGDAGLFRAAYAVMPGGNFGHELAGSLIGANILYEALTVTELARRYGLRGPEVAQRLADDRAILLKARERRPAPMRDEKILMDWNGLMIGALARASSAFDVPDWRVMAERAATYLQRNLPDPKGSWRRRIIRDTAGIPALTCDYASLLWGVMELYEAAKKAEAGERQLDDWLKYASTLADTMLEQFWDDKGGGLFISPDGEKELFMRRKLAYDDPHPSANALAARGLSMLGKALSEPKYAEKAAKLIGCFAKSAALNPLLSISLVTAASLWEPVRPKKAPVPEVPKDTEAENAVQTDSGTPRGESGYAAAETERRRPARSRTPLRRQSARGESGYAAESASDDSPQDQAADARAAARQDRAERRDRAAARRERRSSRTQRRGR